MHFAIFGTGGVGGYFGGRLAQSGQEVSFIARGAHLAAIRRQGLRVESIEGDFLIQPAQASDDPSQIGQVDVVLVTTKAWQVAEAARQIHPLLAEHTLVLPLQNGVSAPDELGAELGKNHILGGLCRISAFIGTPGLIRHVGVPPRIFFGERDASKTERVEKLRAVFAQCAGLEASVPDDIEAAMWDKFVFVAAFSGIGALTRQQLGDFRNVPETRALLKRAVSESVAVALARGIRLPADQVEKTMAFIDNQPASLVSSMHKDILEGRPSELEAQNGEVIKMARKAGLQAPTHEMIYACLLPGEQIARNLKIRR